MNCFEAWGAAIFAFVIFCRAVQVSRPRVVEDPKPKRVVWVIYSVTEAEKIIGGACDSVFSSTNVTVIVSRMPGTWQDTSQKGMEAMKRKGLVFDADSIRADIRAAMLCCGFSESNSQTSWFKVTDDPAEVVDDLKWMLHPGTSTLAEEYVKGTTNALREILKGEPMKPASETTIMNAMPFHIFVADLPSLSWYLPKEVAEEAVILKGGPASLKRVVRVIYRVTNVAEIEISEGACGYVSNSMIVTRSCRECQGPGGIPRRRERRR